jgi:hypothetical protein
MTPGRLLFITGVAMPPVAIVLMLLLAPAYADTRAWQPIYFTIIITGAVIGTPCIVIGVLRQAMYQRSVQGSATQAGQGRR